MSETNANIWFPFMIGDHLGRTQHLTHAEESTYVRLQCHQWQNGRFQEDQIQRIGRLDSDAWSISRASVMQLLSRDEAGLLFIAWLESAKAKYAEKQKKAHEKAQKAAKARWAKRGQRPGEQPTQPMLGASDKQTLGIPPDSATPMPVTFTVTEGTTPPSQAQGDPRVGTVGEVPAKTRKRPLVPSDGGEATETPSPASAASVGSQSGTLGVQSAHPTVQSAERRRPTTGDSRFLPFKGEIVRWWAQANSKPAKQAPWGGREDGELKRMLEAEPHLTMEELIDRLANRWTAVQRCLEHPIGKGNVSAAAPLHQVMSRLSTFALGPVTELGDSL